MSKTKHTKESLESVAKEAVRNGANSLKAIARYSGIDERLFGKYKVNVDGIFQDAGVTRNRRGTPRRDPAVLEASLRGYISQEKRWVSQERMASYVGLTGMGLSAYSIDTNKICEEAGYPKPNNKGCRDTESSALQADSAKEAYINYVQKEARTVRLKEFCDATGYSYESLRHAGVSPPEVHKEAGVPYDRFGRKYSLDDVKQKCVEYMAIQGRYVTAMELQNYLGFSRSTIFNAVGSLAELNASLGFFSDNYGFEGLVRAAILEIFPEEELVRQKKFDDLVSAKGRRLRYDFYLPRLNLLIEADGDQHYVEEAKWYTDSLFERDRLKDKYAEENGITLLRVRYKHNFRSKDLVTVLAQAGIVTTTYTKEKP